MAQFARPDGDVSNPGGWVDQADGGTNLYTVLDDTDQDADNSDYIKQTSGFGTTAYLEVSLSNVTDPGVSTGHVIRTRSWRTGGGTILAAVALYQGATLRASTVGNLDEATWNDITLTLSGAEADAITDYNDLRLRFYLSASFGGTPTELRFSYGELEVPTAPTLVSLAGSQPAPTGSLTKKRLVLLAGAQPANSGAIAAQIIPAVDLAGSQPTARGAVAVPDTVQTTNGNIQYNERPLHRLASGAG